MRLKRWTYLGLELCFFVLFPGITLLFGQEIKADWTLLKQGIHTPWPWYLTTWLLVGLAYAVFRIQSGRQAVAEARSVLSAPAFVESYRKLLTAAIDRLTAVSEADEATRKQLIKSSERDFLIAIAKTVYFFRKATALRSPIVVCNVMKPNKDQLQELLKNIDKNDKKWLEPGGESALDSLLEVKESSMADLDTPANFRLPVYKKESTLYRRTLFGAPRAYVTGQNQVVNCTLWLWPHRGRSSWSVLVRAYKHFWDAKIFSLAALPVVYGTSTVVINVHYKWVRVLGKNPEMLTDLLVPFLAMMSYIYSVDKGE